MSLQFSTGLKAVAQLGIGAGDIAVMAGAGRAVGTWVMNRFKDQALLEFMKVDPEDLIPRRGIIDLVELHKRWDVRLKLLQNGRTQIIKGPTGRPIVENMGSFSWFMTIVISALDAVLPKSAMKDAASQFLSQLFADQVDGLEFLERELPIHIQGWMSAGVVRDITAKARVVWYELLEEGKRLSGDIPAEDVPEIVRFLIWLAGAKDQKDSMLLTTASSDIVAFAFVLQAIGLDLIAVNWKGNGRTYRRALF
jgi:hypothetical protein